MYPATFLPPSSSGIFSLHFQMYACSSRSDGCWIISISMQLQLLILLWSVGGELLGVVCVCSSNSQCGPPPVSLRRLMTQLQHLQLGCNASRGSVRTKVRLCEVLHVHFISTNYFFFFSFEILFACEKYQVIHCRVSCSAWSIFKTCLDPYEKVHCFFCRKIFFNKNSMF